MEHWYALLVAGDASAAWDAFQARYRRLMLATIRRLVSDPDDVMEAFAAACAHLAADDCARLHRFDPGRAGAPAAGTWTVAVVRNLTIDWLRSRTGRDRRRAPPSLTPLQQAIYTAICLEGRTHAEAHGLLSTRDPAVGPFHLFLREVRATFLEAPCPDAPLPRTSPADLSAEASTLPGEDDPLAGLVTVDAARHLERALAQLPPETRLAIVLYVVDRLPAAEVARLVGWPNAKAVYNRVARALAQIRAGFERSGLGPGDLR